MPDKMEYAEFATEQVDVRGELAFEQGIAQVGQYNLLGTADELKVPDSFMKTINELGDTQPTFVTYAVPMGFSRYLSYDEDADVPNRFWPETFLDSLIKKVNEQGLPGYRGHFSEWDISSLPNPAVMWVAATKAAHEQTGNLAALVRGYVYPVDHNISYVKTGAFDNISPSALVRVRPEVMEGQEVGYVEQENILSLDFVRKGMQGLRGAKKLVSEGAAMKRKPDEIALISELAVADLKEYNPTVFHQIVSEAASTKLPDTTTELVQQVTTLTREKVALLGKAAIAEELAAALNCEPSDLPVMAQELATLRAEQIKIALVQELAGIESVEVRKAVEADLTKRNFASVADVKLAVESALSLTKSVIAAIGGHLGGQTMDGETGKKGNTVASPAMQSLIGGK